MDHQTFDRLTRLFGIAGSRRTAWRALIAGALLGSTTRTAMATSSTPCRRGEEEYCGEREECCPGKCFVRCSGGEFCCTGTDSNTGQEWIFCGDRCCLDDGSANPCKDCPHTGAGEACIEFIAGSYRRR
jgi:hypothetical protein